MSISTAREGHQYPPAHPYQVSREAIREFATAVKSQHPVHHDVDAARELGHRDLVAPPSFAVVVAQRAEAAVVQDPEVGIDFSRVVHADERFTHHSPILAGDTLTAATTLDRIRVMGAGAMVTTRTEIADQDGVSRCTVLSSLLVRADEEDDETGGGRA
ncbi:MAG: MaoC family dehydratase N-terminal domain-containing protein [Nesterenkonia sp.]|nr:MaoC family dehydratase N-terminal domain-containing protein [Nesterenkonia sp.]